MTLKRKISRVYQRYKAQKLGFKTQYVAQVRGYNFYIKVEMLLHTKQLTVDIHTVDRLHVYGSQ
jgi:hypothetical protein